MRLDKFLSESTSMSRKEIKGLIKKGIIEVFGECKITPEMQIDETACVFVNGVQVNYKKYVYLVMNKPAGFVSATYDKHDRTVIELIPDEYKHYEPFPVGRLDIDTEGLLILSNDGKFAHELTSPSKEVYKTYYTKCDKPFVYEDKEKFSAGMDLGDFKARPAILEITEEADSAYISICEGKFHQVKRMCEKCGKRVLYLKRVSIGGLRLDEKIKLGECVEYTKSQLEKEIGKKNS